MGNKIRWRLFLPYLIILAVVFTISTIYITNYIKRNEETRWQTQLLDTANLISIQSGPLFGTQGGNLQLVDLVHTSSEALNLPITIVSPEGDILAAHPPGEQPENPLDKVVINRAVTDGEAAQVTDAGISAAAAAHALQLAPQG